MKSEILVFFFLNTRLRENVTRDVMRLVQKKIVRQKKTN
jgi:hypothetical protein